MTAMQSLSGPSPVFDRVAGFALGLTYDQVPDEVSRTAALLILDLIGVAAAAHRLPASRIARDHAARHWAAGPEVEPPARRIGAVPQPPAMRPVLLVAATPFHPGLLDADSVLMSRSVAGNHPVIGAYTLIP